MSLTLSSCVLARGHAVRDVAASRLTLDACWTEQGPADGARPVIERVGVQALTVKRSSMIGAILRDVTIDGLRGDSFSVFLDANEYTRVTLRGKIPTLVIGAGHIDPALQPSFQAAIREAEERAEWTLDISEAIGAVEIRGYRADRLRLNTDRHGVVRRSTVNRLGWTEDDVRQSGFAVAIKLMLDGGWDDAILVANPLDRRYDQKLEALHRLKGEGIAE